MLRVCCFLLMTGHSIFCQTAKIDSIKNVLNSPRLNDKNKLATLFSLCGQYNSLHPDSLFSYVQMAKKLLHATSNISDIATAAHYEAICYSKKGKLDSTSAIIEKYLGDKRVQAEPTLLNKFRINKTGLLVRQNKLKQALENALLILHDAETKGLVEEQVKAQIQIGWVYMELNQLSDALKWFFSALSVNKKFRKVPEPAVLNSNIAAVYNELKKNDSASYFIKLAIEQAKQEQDLSFLCNSYYIYSDICTDNGKIAKAEELLLEGVEIRKKIGDPFYIVSDLAQLGKFYATTRQYDKGIAAIKEGIAISQKNNLRSKLLFLNTTLAENYKVAGDLSNYSNTLNTIIQLKDSLYSQNSAEAMSELQTKYELQKKENTIIQQRFDLAQKNYWFYGAAFLLFFGSIFWHISIKNNKRKQEEKMKLALLEERRLSERAVSAAQEKERKRIAADLHDNLGAYAASISSNVDYITNVQKDEKENKAYAALKTNSQAIVAQLNDTIWVLTREVLALTAISDRLKVFLQRLNESYPNVQMDVLENIENDCQLAPMQAFHLFKILQEAVINSLKHSRCNLVTITIECKQSWRITIADNGIGFTSQKKIITGGNGLYNMQNRSSEAGWNINWEANYPVGTKVIIEDIAKEELQN